jgi:hypothetical protein
MTQGSQLKHTSTMRDEAIYGCGLAGTLVAGFGVVATSRRERGTRVGTVLALNAASLIFNEAERTTTCYLA